MKNLLCLTLLLVLAVVSPTAPTLAQETSPAPPAADTAETKPAEEADAPASQAVEINEDTYRQFMELKDANRQGDIIPETVFKPGSGLQKLDKLPEESQKHLRNELREIIVHGDPWQPGDESKEFRYVPSAAAIKDPALQKQEMEAWGELVDGYNQREAQIYENASGTHAAGPAEGGTGKNPGEGANQTTGSSGQDSEGRQGQQASQDGNPDQADTAGTFSADAVNDPNAKNMSGVFQNAMEFLQKRGQGGSSASGENMGAPSAGGGQPSVPSPAGDQGQSQAQTQTGTKTQTGQQGETSQENATAIASPATASATSTAGTEPSVAGTSQNALEFLQGAGAQAGDQDARDAGSAAADAGQGENSSGTSSQAQADAQQTGQQAGQQTSQQAGQNDGQASAQASGQDSGQGEAQANNAQADAQADAQASGESGEQGQAQASAGDEGKALDGQQTETLQKPVSIPPPDSDTPVTTAEPEEESTEGSSQNALEYLTGESAATGEAADTSPPPAGTLNIQDLLNAQGLGGTPGTSPGTTVPDEGKPSDQTQKDKDGDGQ